MTQVEAFFALARERHAIYLRRRAGQPAPWTSDPVLQKHSFCNVFRELDRTTVWFREYVRGPMAEMPEVLLATVLFRWFNRIETGEAIFSQKTLSPLKKVMAEELNRNLDRYALTAWERFLRTGDTEPLRQSIVNYCGSGPYVTGAYVILGQQGMSKLDGVLKCVGDFYLNRYHVVAKEAGQSCKWKDVAEEFLRYPGELDLEDMWCWLKQVPYLGPFMSYEVVSDLRHTKLLSEAPDVLTWANPGPGAARGLARLHGRPIAGRRAAPVPRAQLLEEMRELLALSRDLRYWPQTDKDRKNSVVSLQYDELKKIGFTRADMWPAWEMREVEHWLCETDKYERLRLGEGSVKKSFRPRES